MAAAKDRRVRAGLPPDVQYDERTDWVIWGDATGGFAHLDWLRLATAALDQALHTLPVRQAAVLAMRDTLEKLLAETPDEDRVVEAEVIEAPHVVVTGDLGDVQSGFWSDGEPGEFRMPDPPKYEPCPNCCSPPERNFPKGMQYVGHGAGWAKCARCEGTGQIVKRTEEDLRLAENKTRAGHE